MYTTDRPIVIIAGSSGLIGTELIKQMLDEQPIEHIYALSRQDLPFFHSKLEVIKNQTLDIHDWDDAKPVPLYGFICLGTTKKQAGSNEALEKIDYELVCKVAQQMKVIGVKRLCVVSSVGASIHSFSHYLRCKGKMEMAIERLEFEHVTFVRPGPLVGLREQPRTDERVVQAIATILRPIMIGPLAKLIPIKAGLVARAMQYSIFAHSNKKVQFLDSVLMRKLLKKYQ
ncbi:NAD(P)H-binding protein [Vibrio sp. 16]|uniref:NAD(P)H-binding protein n=1 Tax=Vibrio sp. 16 TaxID=391586 RepID=UPI002FEF2E15